LNLRNKFYSQQHAVIIQCTMSKFKQPAAHDPFYFDRGNITYETWMSRLRVGHLIHRLGSMTNFCCLRGTDRFPFPPCPCCRVREGGKRKIWWDEMFNVAMFMSTCFDSWKWCQS
jgi:hypothetical protein